MSMFTKIQLSSGAFLCYNDLQRAIASGVAAGASPLPYNIEQGTVPCFTSPIVSSMVSDLFDIVSRSVVLRMNGMILG